MIRFDLIRHARTTWNQIKRYQGQQDAPLSECGQAQCRLWADELSAANARLEYTALVCSDLGRARTTAACLAPALGLEPLVDPRLREQDWGRWTGLTPDEIMAREPDEFDLQSGRGWEFTPPEGESRRQVLARAREALLDWAERLESPVLVVTHQGVIRCLVYELAGRPWDPTAGKLLQPYRRHVVAAGNGALRLAAVNVPLGEPR